MTALQRPSNTSELRLSFPPFQLAIRIQGGGASPAIRHELLTMIHREIEPLFGQVVTAWTRHLDGNSLSWPNEEKRGVSHSRVCSTDSGLEKWGFEIRLRRMALGLTQAQLAERISVSRAHLSQLERGRCFPRAKLARRLQEFFTPAESNIVEQVTQGRSPGSGPGGC